MEDQESPIIQEDCLANPTNQTDVMIARYTSPDMSQDFKSMTGAAQAIEIGQAERLTCASGNSLSQSQIPQVPNKGA